MSIYPPKILERINSLRRVGRVESENAAGRYANFACGSFVRVSLNVDAASKKIVSARFQTNGCAFMTAACDLLMENLTGRSLLDLHGLDSGELIGTVNNMFGNIQGGRQLCINSCIEALHLAFADFRQKQIEEFQGEKALICTCFGISEETIERQIEDRKLETVDEVTMACNAGGGCGSCRMLIEEMLDSGDPFYFKR